MVIGGGNGDDNGNNGAHVGSNPSGGDDIGGIRKVVGLE